MSALQLSTILLPFTVPFFDFSIFDLLFSADKRTSTNDESCRKSPDENSETMEESSARLQISQMSLEEKTSADSENQPE